MTQNGPTEAEHRLMLATELQTVLELVKDGGLSAAGLSLCRQKLRHPDTVATATGNLAIVRAAALDAVCRATAGDNADTLEYYRGIGDLLDACPDTLAGIGGLSE